ncbi:MAG: Panacea domain-containing protein [Planctomycetota bacterium]|nr:Panacea domain-containing protein [Planctomycetota bacterium]
MNIDLPNLIIYIIRKCREKHAPLGQTLATKLLYIIEWDHYKHHQRRLTDVSWVFLHYGPWSPELSSLLRADFAMQDDFQDWGNFQPVVYTENKLDYHKVTLPAELKLSVNCIIEQFAERPMPEILDFVYYDTEPMRSAQERGEALDFSTIVPASKPVFRPAGKISSKEAKRIRELLKSYANSRTRDSIEVATDESGLLEALAEVDQDDFLRRDNYSLHVDSQVISSLQDADDVK